MLAVFGNGAKLDVYSIRTEEAQNGSQSSVI